MIKIRFNILKKSAAVAVMALMLGLAGCGDADKAETTEALVTTQGLAEQVDGTSELTSDTDTDVTETETDTGSVSSQPSTFTRRLTLPESF